MNIHRRKLKIIDVHDVIDTIIKKFSDKYKTEFVLSKKTHRPNGYFIFQKNDELFVVFTLKSKKETHEIIVPITAGISELSCYMSIKKTKSSKSEQTTKK